MSDAADNVTRDEVDEARSLIKALEVIITESTEFGRRADGNGAADALMVLTAAHSAFFRIVATRIDPADLEVILRSGRNLGITLVEQGAFTIVDPRTVS